MPVRGHPVLLRAHPAEAHREVGWYLQRKFRVLVWPQWKRNIYVLVSIFSSHASMILDRNDAIFRVLLRSIAIIAFGLESYPLAIGTGVVVAAWGVIIIGVHMKVSYFSPVFLKLCSILIFVFFVFCYYRFSVAPIFRRKDQV